MEKLEYSILIFIVTILLVSTFASHKLQNDYDELKSIHSIYIQEINYYEQLLRDNNITFDNEKYIGE